MRSRHATSWPAAALVPTLLIAAFVFPPAASDAQTAPADAGSVDSALVADPVTRVPTADSVPQPWLADPRIARRLGAVVPGLGHLYAGEWYKSYPIWVGTVVPILYGGFVYELEACVFALFSGCDAGPRWPYQAAGVLLVAAGGVMWVKQARDAGKAAERRNAARLAKWRRRQHSGVQGALENATLLVEPDGAGGGWRVGVQVAW